MLPQCVMITVKVWRRSVSPHSFTVSVPRRPDSIYARVCHLHVCSARVRVSTHLSTRVRVSTHISAHAYYPTLREISLSTPKPTKKNRWFVYVRVCNIERHQGETAGKRKRTRESERERGRARECVDLHIIIAHVHVRVTIFATEGTVDDDCFCCHAWRNNVVIVFESLSS